MLWDWTTPGKQGRKEVHCIDIGVVLVYDHGGDEKGVGWRPNYYHNSVEFGVSSFLDLIKATDWREMKTFFDRSSTSISSGSP